MSLHILMALREIFEIEDALSVSCEKNANFVYILNLFYKPIVLLYIAQKCNN